MSIPERMPVGLNEKQLSILDFAGFVDKPDTTTGKDRIPQSRSRKSTHQHSGHYSSSAESTSTKRKAWKHLFFFYQSLTPVLVPPFRYSSLAGTLSYLYV